MKQTPLTLRNDNAREQAGEVGKQKFNTGNYASPASIRRRFGRGIAAYHAAKSVWFDENLGATQAQIDKAMRLIAQATGV